MPMRNNYYYLLLLLDCLHHKKIIMWAFRCFPFIHLFSFACIGINIRYHRYVSICTIYHLTQIICRLKSTSRELPFYFGFDYQLCEILQHKYHLNECRLQNAHRICQQPLKFNRDDYYYYCKCIESGKEMGTATTQTPLDTHRNNNKMDLRPSRIETINLDSSNGINGRFFSLSAIYRAIRGSPPYKIEDERWLSYFHFTHDLNCSGEF